MFEIANLKIAKTFLSLEPVLHDYDSCLKFLINSYDDLVQISRCFPIHFFRHLKKNKTPALYFLQQEFENALKLVSHHADVGVRGCPVLLVRCAC